MNDYKVSKHQISHFRSASTDPLETDHGGSAQHNLSTSFIKSLEVEDRRFLKILTHQITLFQLYSSTHTEVCAWSLAAEVRYFNYRCGSKYVPPTLNWLPSTNQ
jgi:hypothetical protein